MPDLCERRHRDAAVGDQDGGGACESHHQEAPKKRAHRAFAPALAVCEFTRVWSMASGMANHSRIAPRKASNPEARARVRRKEPVTK